MEYLVIFKVCWGADDEYGDLLQIHYIDVFMLDIARTKSRAASSEEIIFKLSSIIYLFQCHTASFV